MLEASKNLTARTPSKNEHSISTFLAPVVVAEFQCARHQVPPSIIIGTERALSEPEASARLGT